MAVKASSTITLSFMIDIKSVSRYYKLQSSISPAPTKPTTNPPPSGWALAEPSYTTGSTNTLYFVDLTVFSDDSWSYSDVSKSSSYEAAKEAYNEAKNAQNGVEEVQESKVDKTKVIESVNKSDETALISADRIDVENLFAKNITATGNINFDNEYYQLIGAKEGDPEYGVVSLDAKGLMVISATDLMWIWSESGMLLMSKDSLDLQSTQDSVGLTAHDNIEFNATNNIIMSTIYGKIYAKRSGTNYEILDTGIVKDYVIERGSGGGDTTISWKYRKWNSGIVELWGRRALSGWACDTSFGGMYRTGLIGVADFPSSFKVYYPNIQVSYEPSNGYGAFVWPYSEATTEHPASYYLVRPSIPKDSNGNNVNLAGHLNFYVRGSLVE